MSAQVQQIATNAARRKWGGGMVSPEFCFISLHPVVVPSPDGLTGGVRHRLSSLAVVAQLFDSHSVRMPANELQVVVVVGRTLVKGREREGDGGG